MSAAVKKATKSTKEESTQAPVIVDTNYELVTVENLTPAQIFTDAKISELIDKVKKAKEAFKGDASTKAGQKEIISFAARITRTKTLLDEEIGKDFVAVMKEEPKRIDKLRKLVRDTFEEWAAEVRAPVTAIEMKEKARKEAHEKHIADIGATITFPPGQPSSSEVQRRIDFVNLYQSRDWEEFNELYKTTYKAVTEALNTTMAASKKAEQDAKELAELKAVYAKKAEDDRVEAARLAGIAEGQRQVTQTTIAPIAQNVVHTATSQPAPAPVKDEAKAKVNREILADLMAYGCKEDGAKALIKAIVTGTIRHVTINYGA